MQPTTTLADWLDEALRSNDMTPYIKQLEEILAKESESASKEKETNDKS